MNADRAEDDDDDDSSSSDDGSNCLTPETLKNFIRNHPIPDEDNEIQIAALHFVQSYVLGEAEEGIIVASADEAKIISDGLSLTV